jgi:hypothetical protein
MALLLWAPMYGGRRVVVARVWDGFVLDESTLWALLRRGSFL